MAGDTARRFQQVRGPGVALLAGCALWVALGGTAWAKPRPVLVLPYQGTESDPWFGEAIAETLFVAAQATPALLPIDRGRAIQAARVTGADGAADRSPLALARIVRAEIVFQGDYQRTADDGVTITPRLLDVKTGQTQTLDPVRGPAGRLIETQATIIQAYAKALNLGLKPEEVDRLVTAAKPTTNLTAFEAFAKGRRSALRGTQEGNEGAAELLARAVEVDPTFGLAHYHLGVVHLALGNRWKASAQFRAATQVDTTVPEPFKALGDIFMSSPRRLYDQAIEAYQRAISLRAHYADAHVGLGDARAAKGEHEAAIGHYQKALLLDPLNARVHFALGKIYYGEKGLYYEAVSAYKKAIDLDQFFLDARMGLGEIYEEKGLYKDAVTEYKKVIETDPKHTAAHYNLALAYEKLDPREAIAQWERYIDLAATVATEKEWVDVAKQHLK
ncbi:MAG: tetratricopeptide repeat protein, partial [Candidatus Rokuibacteriota bacterium]